MMGVNPLSDPVRRWAGSGDATCGTFALFVLAHLALWTLVPALTQPNAPLDTLELLYWGHEFEWGYYKHPPLPAWLLEVTCRVFGNAAASTYLLSQICTVVSFWAVWRLGREFLQPRLALLGVVLLEASYYYNFTTPEFNNNVMSRCWWALAVYTLYLAMQSSQRRYWVAAGACVGAGMLSKYDMALLAVSMLLFSVGHSGARRHWRTCGPYLMLVTAGLLFAPHVVWLFAQGFPTFQYAAARSRSAGGALGHVLHPLKFLVSQLPAVLPILLLATPALGWRYSPRRLEPDDDRLTFGRDYLVSMSVLPLMLILLVSLVSGAQVRSMWGAPLWNFLPLALLVTVQSELTPRDFRRVLWNCAAASLLFAAVFAARNIASPYLRGEGSRVHYPGRQLAQLVEQRWRTSQVRPLRLVGGAWWPAANVAFYMADRGRVYGDLDSRNSPWLDDAALQRDGGVLLWEFGDEGEAQAAAWLQRFPRARVQSPLEASWQTDAGIVPVRLGMAIVPPRGDRH